MKHKFDIYQFFGVNKDLPLEEAKEKLENRLKKFKEMIDRKPTETSIRVYERLKESYDSLEEEKQNRYSDKDTSDLTKSDKDTSYFTNSDKDSSDFTINQQMLYKNYQNKKKQEETRYKIIKEEQIKRAKNLKIKSMVVKVVAGVLVGVCALGAGKAVINNIEDESKNNNVCIEYVAQGNDSIDYLKGIFYEYGFSHLEVKEAYRNVNYVYEGDVIVGRTTIEIAKKLEKEGVARIISIDEAVELLGESNSLIGEFKKYSKGESDIAFFIPNFSPSIKS